MRLEVEEVSFDYGTGQNILQSMSFTYESPQVMCLLGCNGVGKSTLLRCIMGELTPATGTIQIDGRPARAYSPRLAHRYHASAPVSTARQRDCGHATAALFSRA